MNILKLLISAFVFLFLLTVIDASIACGDGPPGLGCGGG